MQYTINELRQKLFSPVYDVYEVFQNFFDERYVDLQGLPDNEELSEMLMQFWGIQPIGSDSYELNDADYEAIKSRYNDTRATIMVWWPNVRVTNEHDKFVDIQDLYARIVITMEGRIPYENTGFQLVRSTFSEQQFNTRYVHSHVPRLDWRNVCFQNPCLGRGPIRHTILDLKNNSEEALWMLFCQELSLYVTVESLNGGPYIRLEEISSSGYLYTSKYSEETYNHLDREIMWMDNNGFNLKNILGEFIEYYISLNRLPFGFNKGEFVCGLPYFDYMVSISNAFIEWVNQHGTPEMVNALYDSEVLLNVTAKQGKFYKSSRYEHVNYTQYEGQHILDFKGRAITLHIAHGNGPDEQTVVVLLSHKIAMCILHYILQTINYHYKNGHNNFQQGSTTASTHQTVCYL